VCTGLYCAVVKHFTITECCVNWTVLCCGEAFHNYWMLCALDCTVLWWSISQLLNVVCTGLYCAVVKHFTITECCVHWTVLCCSEAFHNSKSLRNKRLSLKLSKCDMIISMIDEVYRCTLSKVIRFSRVRWSITSLRLERIILCEIPHLIISYRSCDQCWSFHQIVTFS